MGASVSSKILKARLKKFFIGLVVVVGVLYVWPYRLIGSPKSTLRVRDDGGHPLAGLRVTRSWRTSEGHQGQDEATTDPSGSVSFQRQAVHMSLLKRITKPLLIFVPAMCGPSWEVYGMSEFDIYWPSGYTLRFDDKKWKRENEVWKDNEDVCVRDPAPIQQNQRENYVELYFFNKSKDFDYTVTLYGATNGTALPAAR
jgi:hypothetical protein